MIEKRKIRISILAIVSIILAGCLYIFFMKLGIIIPCFFHELTGFYCPGCGITRMILSFIHLDFYQAFRFNPFVFCLIPFILYYFFQEYYAWLLNKKKKVVSKCVWLSILFGLILFGILRNTDFFHFLAPTLIR